MDPFLLAIAEAAEREDRVPRIRLLAGGSIAAGIPTSERNFRLLTEERMMSEWQAYLRSLTKKQRKETNLDPAQMTQDALKALQRDGSPSGALCLKDAELWPASGGDGLKLPVVRIPFDSVDAWWTSKGERLRARGDGGWFFGGAVSVPEG